MKKIKKLERLVYYHQNAEEIVRHQSVSEIRIILSLIFIGAAFLFMAYAAYSGITNVSPFIPAAFILAALYVNTWTAEEPPGSWLLDEVLLKHESFVYKDQIKSSILNIYPFPDPNSDDDRETIEIAQDIIN